MSILDQYKTIIPKFQANEIDLAFSLDTAISIPLQSENPTITITKISSTEITRLSSEAMNGLMSTTAVDIKSLFASSNFLRGKITTLERLGSDTLLNLERDLTRLENLVEEGYFRQWAAREGYSLAFHETFADNTKVEDSDIWYNTTDRKGTVNVDEQIVTLQVVNEFDRIHAPVDEINIANVKVIDQYGYVSKVFQSLREPKNAIDNSTDNFWGEVAVTEEPISLYVNLTEKYNYPQFNNNDVTIDRGAVAVLQIEFKNMQILNTIQIAPFTEYPVRIMGIAALDAAGQLIKYVYIGQEYINQTTTFNFPSVDGVQYLNIILHQPHFRKDVFLITDDQKRQTTLWRQIIGEHPIVGTPKLQLGKTIEDTFDLALEAIKPTTSQVVPYIQYVYVYGIHDLRVWHRVYASDSVIVSRPYETIRNVIQGALFTKEDIPLDNNGFPKATIEYDITFDDGNPFYPIAPINKAFIYEQQTGIAPGKLLPRLFIKTVMQVWDTSGNTINIDAYDRTTITSANIVADQEYVIQYIPDDVSRFADLVFGTEIDKIKHTTEVITGGTDRNQILQLKREPYVNHGLISSGYNPNGKVDSGDYVPVQVMVDNANLPVIIDGIDTTIQKITQDTTKKSDVEIPFVYNETDYIAVSDVTLPEYDREVGELGYIHLANRLVLNASLDPTAKIRVNYDRAIDNLRIRVRMRRHVNDTSITPKVFAYMLVAREGNISSEEQEGSLGNIWGGAQVIPSTSLVYETTTPSITKFLRIINAGNAPDTYTFKITGLTNVSSIILVDDLGLNQFIDGIDPVIVSGVVPNISGSMSRTLNVGQSMSLGLMITTSTLPSIVNMLIISKYPVDWTENENWTGVPPASAEAKFTTPITINIVSA